MREHARPLFASATHPVSLPPLKTTMPDLPRTRRAGPAPSGEVLIKVPPERAVMTPTWELLEHVKGERERAAECGRAACASPPESWPPPPAAAPPAPPPPDPPVPWPPPPPSSLQGVRRLRV